VALAAAAVFVLGSGVAFANKGGDNIQPVWGDGNALVTFAP
jgi:hypothetical protein